HSRPTRGDPELKPHQACLLRVDPLRIAAENRDGSTRRRHPRASRGGLVLLCAVLQCPMRQRRVPHASGASADPQRSRDSECRGGVTQINLTYVKVAMETHGNPAKRAFDGNTENV